MTDNARARSGWSVRSARHRLAGMWRTSLKPATPMAMSIRMTHVSPGSRFRPRDHMVTRRPLAVGGMTPEPARDHSFDLKTLVMK